MKEVKQKENKNSKQEEGKEEGTNIERIKEDMNIEGKKKKKKRTKVKYENRKGRKKTDV